MKQSFLGTLGELGSPRRFSGIGILGVPSGPTSNVEVFEDSGGEWEAGRVFVDAIQELLVCLKRDDVGPSSLLGSVVEWIIFALQHFYRSFEVRV